MATVSKRLLPRPAAALQLANPGGSQCCRSSEVPVAGLWMRPLVPLLKPGTYLPAA